MSRKRRRQKPFSKSRRQFLGLSAQAALAAVGGGFLMSASGRSCT
ncbi:MAG: twin-arginine translocation signal domain-containing protein, partial [Bdellovibrionota bacterium]